MAKVLDYQLYGPDVMTNMMGSNHLMGWLKLTYRNKRKKYLFSTNREQFAWKGIRVPLSKFNLFTLNQICWDSRQLLLFLYVSFSVSVSVSVSFSSPMISFLTNLLLPTDFKVHSTLRDWSSSVAACRADLSGGASTAIAQGTNGHIIFKLVIA